MRKEQGLSEINAPVTPTMQRGWPANRENITAPSTLARSTSLTPKLLLVCWNMSSANAIAGSKLRTILTNEVTLKFPQCWIGIGNLLFEEHVKCRWDHAVRQGICPVWNVVRRSSPNVFAHSLEGMNAKSVPDGLGGRLMRIFNETL